jgi:hypothetical protein
MKNHSASNTVHWVHRTILNRFFNNFHNFILSKTNGYNLGFSKNFYFKRNCFSRRKLCNDDRFCQKLWTRLSEKVADFVFFRFCFEKNIKHTFVPPTFEHQNKCFVLLTTFILSSTDESSSGNNKFYFFHLKSHFNICLENSVLHPYVQLSIKIF